MSKYICTKEFFIDEYDDNGFPTSKFLDIEKGEIFTVPEGSFRCVGGNDTVRLENGNLWLEISKTTLEEQFEKAGKQDE